MRRKTYTKIIEALRAGINSKRGIQDYTGLSWGSCSPVINHLLSQGVIVTQATDHQGKPSKGRKTTFYNFSQHHFLLMGMEIDKNSIKCCVTTMGNEHIGSSSLTVHDSINFINFSERIVEAFTYCCQQFEIEADKVNCISFSLPGAIDVDKKIWLYSPRIPEIQGIDFNKLKESVNLPDHIYIQHDIHAQANSVIPSDELNERDYVFVHVGEGIGMSANMGGILYGSRGFAGEIGHLPYPEASQEIICSCGNMNCLETVLNAPRILEVINNKHEMEVASIDEITDQAIIRSFTDEYILPPLLFMSTIIANIFDPRRIIIGGAVLAPFYKYLISGFEKELRQMAWFNGPGEICWYKAEDMDGSYGAILHSGARIVQDFISDIDLDHHR